jgi:hypothetical protein
VQLLGAAAAVGATDKVTPPPQLGCSRVQGVVAISCNGYLIALHQQAGIHGCRLGALRMTDWGKCAKLNWRTW